MEAKYQDKILLWEKALNGLKCPKTSSEEIAALNLRQRLLDVCVRYGGVGVAAPQIGVNLRAAIVNFEETTKLLVNPEITFKSGSGSIMLEGCLSIPGAYRDGRTCMNRGRVKRSDDITVKYETEAGVEKTERFTDFLAHIVAHEIDHMNGVFFIDYLGKIEREFVMSKFENFKKHHAIDSKVGAVGA